MSINLEQVVLDGGSRFVNFFEGRILTGRDLRDEQAAARKDRDALGRALGHGVVHGLEVTDATPTGAGATPAVRVRAGLGVTREGQALDLVADRVVRLAELPLGNPGRSTGDFDLCATQPDTSGAPTANGFHILTLAPATAFEEEAPKAGLTDPGTAGGCGRRYITLGLQFRLLRFDPALLAGDDLGGEIAALSLLSGDEARSRLRNLVAHLGFGTAARQAFPLDPFARANGASASADLGIEARLAAASPAILSACELPLAVLRLRGGQIEFIDMWTCRRGLRTPPATGDWPLIATRERAVRDAATFYQFQDQLGSLFARLPNPAAITARDFFRFLPPAGFLPLAEARPFLPDSAPPLALDPGRVVPLVEEALRYPAADLNAAPGFTIYRVDGVDDWLLFVSDVVPSAERAVLDREALADRLSALENTIEAPALVVGRVTRSFAPSGAAMASSVLFSNPWAGVTVRAEGTALPTVDAITDENGQYRLDLLPGAYVLRVIDGDTILNDGGRDVEAVRGDTATENFNFPFLFQIVTPT